MQETSSSNEEDSTPLNFSDLNTRCSQLTYEVKAGEDFHRRVLQDAYQRSNQQSRLYHRYPRLSSLSHDRAHQAGLGLTLLYFFSLIVYLSAGGTQRWTNYLDAHHWSDGAPPSDLQMRKDALQAEKNTGLIFGLIPLAFMTVVLIIHFWIDQPRLMAGYRHIQLPPYDSLNTGLLLRELVTHSEFLLKKTSQPGSQGLAYLLSALQENFIPDAEEPIEPLDVAEDTDQPSSSHAPPAHARKQASFLTKLNASVAAHHVVVDLMPDVDKTQLFVRISHDHDEPGAIEALKKEIACLHKRLDSLTITGISPIDPEDFIPLLALAIRRKMSDPMIHTSIEHRALFLKTLLEDPYYKEHPQTLGIVLCIFFQACVSETPASHSEKQKDVQTYLQLQDKHKQVIITSLETKKSEGEPIARMLLKQKPSRTLRTRIMRSFVAEENANGVRLIVSDDLHQPLRPNDSAVIGTLLS